ncbi:MAG: class I SAM-dependent methyltransferase [Elusimicrobia bacterium]|nr:class I SAM-dependent methyltransferase [Elusimicrobiota bacterium]
MEKEIMTDDIKSLYLGLLKKSLTFNIWPEPLVPVSFFNSGRSWLIRCLFATATKLLGPWGLVLARQYGHHSVDLAEGKSFALFADTMVGLKRLDNLQTCLETVLREGIPGEMIETGVWRGGACIFMRGVLAAHGVTDRKVFVADSFEGLPKPDVDLFPEDKGDRHSRWRFLAVSLEEVKNNFLRYGLLDDQVVFVKGFFHDSLPHAPIGSLSVLRLDGDMYGSTMDVLENLYKKLNPGGFCIIDDYALPGCRKAVNDFREKHGICEPMIEIDWTGCYWRKGEAVCKGQLT